MPRKGERYYYSHMILYPDFTVVKEIIFFSLPLHWKITGCLGENYITLYKSHWSLMYELFKKKTQFFGKLKSRKQSKSFHSPSNLKAVHSRAH